VADHPAVAVRSCPFALVGRRALDTATAHLPAYLPYIGADQHGPFRPWGAAERADDDGAADPDPLGCPAVEGLQQLLHRLATPTGQGVRGGGAARALSGARC